MGTESTGFEPEPVFPMAAEIRLTRERLYAAQNLLVQREAEIARLENERAGKVLVDPEDLRAVLSAWGLNVLREGIGDEWDRLAAAAGLAR